VWQVPIVIYLILNNIDNSKSGEVPITPDKIMRAAYLSSLEMR
jgi:hypothetical protein